MGEWTLVIQGHGQHDNNSPNDVEKLADTFLSVLNGASHGALRCELTIGSRRTIGLFTQPTGDTLPVGTEPKPTSTPDSGSFAGTTGGANPPFVDTNAIYTAHETAQAYAMQGNALYAPGTFTTITDGSRFRVFRANLQAGRTLPQGWSFTGWSEQQAAPQEDTVNREQPPLTDAELASRGGGTQG